MHGLNPSYQKNKKLERIGGVRENDRERGILMLVPLLTG